MNNKPDFSKAELASIIYNRDIRDSDKCPKCGKVSYELFSFDDDHSTDYYFCRECNEHWEDIDD